MQFTYIIKASSDGMVPVGSIVLVDEDSLVPRGWFFCDGSPYDPEEYPELHQTLTRPARRSWLDVLFRRRKPRSSPFGENLLPDLRIHVA